MSKKSSRFEKRFERKIAMDKIEPPKKPQRRLCSCGDPNCSGSMNDGMYQGMPSADSPPYSGSSRSDRPGTRSDGSVPDEVIRSIHRDARSQATSGDRDEVIYRAENIVRRMSVNSREAEYIMKAIASIESGLRDMPSFRNMPPYITSADLTSTIRSVTSTPPQSYLDARKKVQDYILKVTDKLGWDAVVGNDEAKLALQETIEASTLHAEIYKFYSMAPPKGVLLYGPPGCGKTMYAKATASAIARMSKKDGAEMILINGPSIQTPYVGQTEEIIRNLFAFAKEYKKYHGHQLVLFFDEADSIFPDRDKGYRYEASNVATFLAEMDGVGTDNSAFVLLATNRPDSLDSACLRDGRCDRKIKVGRPTLEAMHHILTEAAKHVPLHGSLDFLSIIDDLVHPRHKIGEYDFINLKTGVEMKGYVNLAHIISGALVVGLVSKAKSFAFRRDITSGQTTGLTKEDFLSAIEQMVRDNSGLTHTYALQEIMESLPREEVKFKGTLN